MKTLEKKIESLDDWYALAAELAEDDYSPYQYQYNWNEPQGFHVRFWRKEGPIIEVVTHSQDVKAAIMKFSPT